MANFRIKERTGRDLYDFLTFSEIDKDRAFEQALVDFVQYKNKPSEDWQDLTVNHIVKLSNKALVTLKSKVFPITTIDNVEIRENNVCLIDDNKIIKSYEIKEIPSNIIEKIATYKNNNTNTTDLLYKIIPDFYDISHEEIMNADYKVIAFMFQQIDAFFQGISKPGDNFDLEDAWVAE